MHHILKANSHYEPSTDDTTRNEVMAHIEYEDFLDALAQKQPKLADIRRLKDGYTIPTRKSPSSFT